MGRAPLISLLAAVYWVQRCGGFSQAVDSDFTFTLPAGHRECFFQTMKREATMEIEYQVGPG